MATKQLRYSDDREMRRLQYVDAGYWRDERLSDHVQAWACRYGDAKLAVVDEHARLTWRQLWERAVQVAGNLHALGVRPGDVVGTQQPNGHEVVLLHVALDLMGAVHNPLAMQFRESELNQIETLARPKLVLFPEQHGDVDFRKIHERTALGGSGACRSVESVLRLRSSGQLPTAPRPRPDDAAMILNTSGTTALKGVVHTHGSSMFSTRVAARALQVGEDDVVICAVPMAWGGGLVWNVRIALHIGATLVALPRWDAANALRWIEKLEGSYVYGPPTIAHDLLGVVREQRYVFKRLVKLVCAGAPIPRHLARDVAAQPNLMLIPGYGQTEHLHSVIGRPDDPFDDLVSSDGRVLEGIELIAVGTDRSEVAIGEPGELLCRGPNVASAYCGQPELSAEVFPPTGWQVTQDLGYFDEAGYLRVSGRRRDIIIRGGLNISPREVEEQLSYHPSVRRAAVVGYPDPRYGERICAFVVPEPGSPPTLEDLNALLTERGVGRYKHPERLVVVDALPVTDTGKVRHAVLRESLTKSSQG